MGLRAPGDFAAPVGLPAGEGFEIRRGLTAPAGLAGFPAGFLGVGSLFSVAGLDGFFPPPPRPDGLALTTRCDTGSGRVQRGTSAQYSGDGSQSAFKRSRSPLEICQWRRVTRFQPVQARPRRSVVGNERPQVFPSQVAALQKPPLCRQARTTYPRCRELILFLARETTVRSTAHDRDDMCGELAYRSRRCSSV